MSELGQKSQVITTTASPDEAKPTQAQADSPDTTAPESAHQGATESDVTKILPPVSGPTTISQSDDTLLDVEIDPADEITPG